MNSFNYLIPFDSKSCASGVHGGGHRTVSVSLAGRGFRMQPDTRRHAMVADRVHPITAGLLGGDQRGTAGAGYALVADSPYVDFVRYHDYDDSRFLPLRLSQTPKPLVVTELGINAGSCLPLHVRAERIGARIDSYAELGAAGALLWAFVPDPRPNLCTYDIGPADPVLVAERPWKWRCQS